MSLKEAYELAGVLYRDLNAGFEDDPYDANWWRIVSEAAQNALSGPAWPPPDLDSSAQDRRLQALERYVGPFIDATLLRLGVNASVEDRPMLLRAFAERIVGIATKLERNAKGNFAPDPAADQIPKWRGNRPTPTPKPSGLTFDDLLTRWKKEIQPMASTIGKYQTAAADFKTHLKHNDPRRVIKADLVAWKEALLDRNLSAKTIKDDRLAAIRALYNFAKRNDLIDTNPVDGVTISARPKPGETMLPYDDFEVAAILSPGGNIR